MEQGLFLLWGFARFEGVDAVLFDLGKKLATMDVKNLGGS